MYQPANTLADRTFIGLLVAQFLAAFNDQAIHASAMFFAIHKGAISDKFAITLMPILFYAPWAIFCTLAGYLADRFSKRHTLVFWKIAEVVICAVALGGFWLGEQGHASGPYIVLACVFLMGMHSAFFVPAKYGVMPEILQPHLLSRGNGLLESLSFLAVILGTVAGGMMSYLFNGRESYIGEILLVLAIAGAVASLMIRTMPAADLARPFPKYVYGPLLESLRKLFRYRPLTVAVVGIAFFTFVVAFMRAAVYMLGETQDPHWNEFKTSAVVGATAVGIAIGSPMAGWLSGKKVELGLIPLGGLGMVTATVAAALLLDNVPMLVVAIMAMGLFTGFYIVPLYTLQQHRAPKDSKGDVIATTNFINVTGAIAASLVFLGVINLTEASGVLPSVPVQAGVAKGELIALRGEFGEFGRTTEFEVKEADGGVRTFGHAAPPVSFGSLMNDVFSPREVTEEVDRAGGAKVGSLVAVDRYDVRGVTHYRLRPADAPVPATVFDREPMPRYLFLGAGAMTLFTLVLLYLQLPDLPRRSAWFLRSLGGPRLDVRGLGRVPGAGAVVLATNARTPAERRAVLSAVDRYTRLLPTDATDADLATATASLRRGHLVGVEVSDGVGASAEKQLRHVLAAGAGAVLPVYCGPDGTGTRIVFGESLPATATVEEVRAAVARAGAAG